MLRLVNILKRLRWKDIPTGYEVVTCSLLRSHIDLLNLWVFIIDVAWAPSILPKAYIASASQDKTAIIWTSTTLANAESSQVVWAKRILQFDSVVWRVSWSLSGNALAISGGDNKVTVWKENLKGEWEQTRVEESS